MKIFKTTDHRFNKIILLKVMPLIAEAFCTLSQGVDGNRLCQIDSDTTKEICELKAKQLKSRLNDYIDKQVAAFENIPREPCPAELRKNTAERIGKTVD